MFADQVFIDPTFFGIFICGPLQSFLVNVCTDWFHSYDWNHVRQHTVFSREFFNGCYWEVKHEAKEYLYFARVITGVQWSC